MRRLPDYLRTTCVFLLSAALAAGQNTLTVEPANADRFGWLTRPYQARNIAPVRLTNSPRLNSLIRAGSLYLSAQDVVALAIENNIDIEVQRYTPLLAQEVLRRAEAGGALRSVGLPVVTGAQSVSLQGVTTNAGGGLGVGGGGISSGGGIVTQLGPGIPTLDPQVSAFVNFQHATTPQSNTVLTGTTALVQNTRTVNASFSQSFQFGLTAQLGYSSNYVSVNSQFFNLNPFTTGNLDLQLTQNLLQGFGSAVNGRNIRVQRNNVKVSDLQFKQQVINTVSAALNLYWDFVAFNEDVRARRQAVETARTLFGNNRKQVELGSLAEIEITRAEAQVYATQQDLTIAQTNLLQQETILKNVLARNGVAEAGLTGVRIVPLDRITIPPDTAIQPVEDLISEAARNRPELQQARINLESNQLNLVGIRNSLKPSLQAFTQLTNNGLTGDLSALGAAQPGVGYLAGGYGNLLGQIFRRNYPNYSAGFSLNIPLRNRAAQADYAISVIELRQNELNLRRNLNQVRVDVQNAVIGIQQARARYEAALRSRVLQEQTLSADQRKFDLGAATPFQVIQDQRDLASAQSSETQAMANYTHARISLEEALGKTLDVNNVSISEALKGQVSVASTLPADLPTPPPDPAKGATP
ncbi:MAG: TolC family protein [Bryobacteraceae bacterium]|nr:TolC family protein [Bryobacteraceae bacterium]